MNHCSAVALMLVVCVAASHSGRSGAAEVDFSELVKLAQRYDLPMPPRDAQLVLANTGWTSLVSSSSTSRDPGSYSPAFVLQKLPSGNARVLMGWAEETAEAHGEHLPALRPYSLVRQKPALKGYLLCINNMSSFVTAVQLAARGDVDAAGKLWEQIHSAEYFDDESALEWSGRLLEEPQNMLARCLYQYFYVATLPENANLKAIHQKLARLKTEFPFLFSNNPDDYYGHRRTLFVNDLGTTIAAAVPRAGSVEAMLVARGDLGDSHSRTCNPDDDPGVKQERAIHALGVAAIPELIRLADDRRLTRCVQQAQMRRPEDRVRLGDLAQGVLEQMGGVRQWDQIDPLWKQPGMEQRFFEQAVVTREQGRITWYNDVPLWILGQKYPRSLLTLSAAIPVNDNTAADPYRIAEAIGHSQLGRGEKTAALVDMCGRLTNLEHKRNVLLELARLDEARCLELVRPLLAKLPADVGSPYWTSTPPKFSHIIMELQDDAVWKEYLTIVRRASVGLRMEMMNSLNYAYIGDKNRQRRLAVLAAFLDDKTVRDPKVKPHKYEGPCAAFTFDKIEVRNFVADQIASILDFPDRPDEFWTPQQWEELRNEVREALKKEQLPDLDG